MTLMEQIPGSIGYHLFIVPSLLQVLDADLSSDSNELARGTRMDFTFFFRWQLKVIPKAKCEILVVVLRRRKAKPLKF